MARAEELPDSAEQENGISGTTEPTKSKRKKKGKKKAAKRHVLAQYTIGKPQWAYIVLQRVTISTPATPLDELTVHLQLRAALSQFLGLHGAAIPFDILKIQDQDVWIRLSSEDRMALSAAVGGWVRGGEGWTVKGWSSWDVNVPSRDSGQDLFAE